MLPRLPIESSRPLVVFALGRLAIAVVGVAAMVVLDLPEDDAALATVAAIALTWSGLVLFLTLRNPHRALSPTVAGGDLVALIAIEVVAPETYGGVRLAALSMVAVHAQLQGEARALLFAAIGTGLLVAATAVRGDAPVEGDVLAFYEAAFVTCALATGVVVARLRTEESAGRLRNRELTRRTIQTESEVRRRVAEAIHDGPVQELIGLDMILSSARKAATEGRREDAARLLDDARQVAERNLRTLRDEIVELGPYPSEALGFDAAVQNCLPAWKRRYGFEVALSIERVPLGAAAAGALFRIAQEAVANAGRHGRADTVSISLRSVDSRVELRVADDGHGFNGDEASALRDPGHLGIASMRERAELIEGELHIESSDRGTRVLVTAPLASAANGSPGQGPSAG